MNPYKPPWRRLSGESQEEEDISWAQTQQTAKVLTTASTTLTTSRDNSARKTLRNEATLNSKNSKIKIKRKTTSSSIDIATTSSSSESNGAIDSHNASSPMHTAPASFVTILNSPPQGKTPSKISKPAVLSNGSQIKADHPACSVVSTLVPTPAAPLTAMPCSQSEDSVLCLRLVAIDIVDNPVMRNKDLRCIRPTTQLFGREVVSSSSSSEVTLINVILSGCWYDTDVNGGDILHVVLLSEDTLLDDGYRGTVLDDMPIIVDDRNNLLIVHPDELISPSKVVDSLGCARRGFLNSRLPGFGGTSSAAVLGSVKHVFIEQVVTAVWAHINDSAGSSSSSSSGPLDRAFISGVIEAAIASNVNELIACRVERSQAEDELRRLENPTVAWARRAYLDTLAQDRENSIVTSLVSQISVQSSTTACSSGGAAAAKIRTVGIEELFCVPILGVKGQIDLVACGAVCSPGTDGDLEHVLYPVEVKSGLRKPLTFAGHKAQVLLYTLALRIREMSKVAALATTLASPPTFGVLLYLSADKYDHELIRLNWNDIRPLLFTRNSVANWARRSSTAGLTTLPPLIRNKHECSRCFQAAECMVSHAALERGNSESSGVPELFAYSTRGVSKAHLQYFDHSSRLVDLEASAVESQLHLLWTETSSKREQRREACVSGLKVESVAPSLGDASVVSLHREGNSIPSIISKGDRVFISAEVARRQCSDDIEDLVSSCDILQAVEPCVAVGFVSEVEGQRIKVTVSALSQRLQQLADSSGVSLRLDRDESALGVGSMRSNVMRLVASRHVADEFNAYLNTSSSQPDNTTPLSQLKPAGSAKLRGLVIDLVRPKYHALAQEDASMFCPDRMQLPYFLSLLKEAGRDLGAPNVVYVGSLAVYPGCNPVGLLTEYKTLNLGQRDAVRKALAAEDYSLVLGVPGSGKTSVLSFIVRAMIAKGRRVFISSHTNSAVDNLLSKIAQAGVGPFMACRLGNVASFHESIRSFTMEEQSASLDQTKLRFDLARLVASTVLTASSHPLLTAAPPFDCAIVDEAGQVATPAILGPLLLAKSFCLVGDHYQLPPLVNSEEAQVGGLDVSLFKTLAEAHPEAVCPLTCQYRMNSDIMSLCNRLIYGLRLECPDPAVARSCIQLTELRVKSVGEKDWLREALKPSRRVVFLNTDSLSGNKDTIDEMVLNGEECSIGKASNIGHGGSVANPSEVMATRHLVWALASSGYHVKAVGVLSPYRSQVGCLKLSLQGLEKQMNQALGLEASTIDRFQGRDAGLIILSLVRSNDACAVGDLLRDWRRINVAVTRAKQKLVIIGSLKMMTLPLLAELKSVVQQSGWVVDFQPSAFSVYGCP